MRFLVRLASLLVLCVAIFLGVIDSILSVAATAPVLTSVETSLLGLGGPGETLTTVLETGLTGSAGLEKAGPWLLAQPATAVLVALSLILWMAAWKSRHPAGRFAA